MPANTSSVNRLINILQEKPRQVFIIHAVIWLIVSLIYWGFLQSLPPLLSMIIIIWTGILSTHAGWLYYHEMHLRILAQERERLQQHLSNRYRDLLKDDYVDAFSDEDRREIDQDSISPIRQATKRS